MKTDLIFRLIFVFILTVVMGAPLTACSQNSASAESYFETPEEVALAKAICRGTGVERALAKVPSPDIIGRDGMTLILWSMGCSTSDGLEAYLEAGADPNLQTTGHSAVTYAVEFKDPYYLDLLLRYGGNPDAIVLNDPEISNALMLAFEKGAWTDDWTNYHRLLEAVADINQQLKRGGTIGSIVVTYGRYCELLKLFDRGYTKDLEYVEKLIGGRMEGSDIYVDCRTRALDRIEELKAEGYK